jgi:hypothetical protein
VLVIASPGLAASNVICRVCRDDAIVVAVKVLAHELVHGDGAELSDRPRVVHGLIVELGALTEFDLVGASAKALLAFPF